MKTQHSSVQLLSCVWPQGRQHARLPCPSPTPWACSNSCPSSRWCHATISSSVIPFSFCLQSFPIRVFPNEPVLRIRWSKYWSFSISPSNEYSGLISENKTKQNKNWSILFGVVNVWCVTQIPLPSFRMGLPISPTVEMFVVDNF